MGDATVQMFEPGGGVGTGDGVGVGVDEGRISMPRVHCPAGRRDSGGAPWAVRAYMARSWPVASHRPFYGLVAPLSAAAVHAQAASPR